MIKTTVFVTLPLFALCGVLAACDAPEVDDGANDDEPGESMELFEEDGGVPLLDPVYADATEAELLAGAGCFYTCLDEMKSAINECTFNFGLPDIGGGKGSPAEFLPERLRLSLLMKCHENASAGYTECMSNCSGSTIPTLPGPGGTTGDGPLP